MNELKFTNSWFDTTAKPIWEEVIPKLQPKKILEIGSFEGASTCFLIKKLSHKPIEIHCVDTWEGGAEHKSGAPFHYNMREVEKTFHHNISIVKNKNVDLHIHRGFSDLEMSKLLSGDYKNYFDFIYVDGSHESPDVLCDAVLGFRLLSLGGVMIFDDYLWSPDEHKNLYQSPKPAIDSFVNLYWQKLEVTSTPCQLIVRKVNN